MQKNHLIAGLMLTVLLPGLGRSAELRAAVARISDPVPARILALRTETAGVAFVVSDMPGFQSQRFADEARKTLHLDLVLFAGSGGSPPQVDPNKFERALIAALPALSQSFSARVAAGYGTADLSFNQRKVDESGKVTVMESNPDKRATGPLWPTIPVWRFDDEDGGLRAVLFSCACSGMQAVFAQVEKALGPKVVALFVTGASADLGTFADSPDKLGNEVIRVARSLTPQAELNPSLSLYRSTIGEQSWNGQKPFVIESATVVLNKMFALAAIPGVPFVEYQINLGDRSPAAHTILSANTFTDHGAAAGVLPTIRAATEGGYESHQVAMQTGTGEELIDTAIVNIYRALGKLDDIPRGSLVREMPPEGKRAR